MPAQTKYTPGQRLVAVYTLNRCDGPEIADVEVTKVGRKWVHFKHCGKPYSREGKFDPSTFHRIDGGDFSSPGTVWPTLEAYEDYVRAEVLWRELRGVMNWTPPRHLSEAAIREILAKVKGES